MSEDPATQPAQEPQRTPDRFMRSLFSLAGLLIILGAVTLLLIFGLIPSWSG